VRYAEVIGDPIVQSKSPIIHKYWLDRLNLEGDYRRTRVPRETLAEFLAERRTDPDWLGCNLTIPHKENAAALIDHVDPRARAIGAVNCVIPTPDGLAATNTDIDGIAAALDSTPLEGRRAAIIGAGGGARAAFSYLASRKVVKIAVLVRNPTKAEPLRMIAPETPIEIGQLSAAETLLDGAEAVINASPLGMIGCPEMPNNLLTALARRANGTTLFDMVYNPLETAFLLTGRAAGGRAVDGLTMLIGQAARAFELFFGQSPPPPDGQLRDLLTTDRHNSA
jgi:shikimate dehydrogenase